MRADRLRLRQSLAGTPRRRHERAQRWRIERGVKQSHPQRAPPITEGHSPLPFRSSVSGRFFFWPELSRWRHMLYQHLGDELES